MMRAVNMAVAMAIGFGVIGAAYSASLNQTAALVVAVVAVLAMFILLEDHDDPWGGAT